MADSASGQKAQAHGHPPPKAQDGRIPPRPGYFPMGYKEGFSQWWTSISPAAAEHKVLSFVPYLKKAPTQSQTGTVAPSSANNNDTSAQDDTSHSATFARVTSHEEDPHGPRRWHSSLVKLAGKDRALNEFSVERIGEPVEHNLVMLHGYGAGLGFFYKNFEPLSRVPRWRLYALDLLGMGRSSRPPFRIRAKDRQGKIAESEAWFVDALEEWRVKRKIDRFTLLGHSLGGYMAVAYALKYPGHLDKLILASPVGIPEDPYAVDEAMPEPEESTMQSELSQDQSSSAAQKDGNTPRRRPYPKWLTTLWDANFSPFAFVRWSGPLGPRLVSGWTSRRFSQMPPEEGQALHDYAYSLFRQRGSGEYALSHILAPGAFARSPMIRRIGGVGSQEYAMPPQKVEGHVGDSSSFTAEVAGERMKEQGVPVVLMYGENDWMDVAGGYASVEKLAEAKRRRVAGLTTEEAKKDQGSAKVLVVKGAGHHVYLDGWEEFNEMMRVEMGDVEAETRD